MKSEVLFISKNYPPKLGGLETYSYNLIKEFENDFNVYKIVLRRSNLNLLWFLPFGFFKALYLVRKHSFKNIHLCDGLLAPLGSLLKYTTRSSISISIHGLDITYRNTLYQWLIPRCVERLDKIICVSRSTLEECAHRGISRQKCTVIPNGIQPDELYLQQTPVDLRISLENLLKAIVYPWADPIRYPKTQTGNLKGRGMMLLISLGVIVISIIVITAWPAPETSAVITT